MAKEDPASARPNVPADPSGARAVPAAESTQNERNHLHIASDRYFAREKGNESIGGYQELDVALDAEAATLWCYMRPRHAPSITPTILYDFLDLHGTITSGSILKAQGFNEALKYYVQGSRVPEIYNLGGDLAFMLDCIRTGNRKALLLYAHNCVEVVFNIFTGFSRDIVSLALVEGDALGGGFEAALCCNYIIAERKARFGLPEILFNCFPGMGAYSFLSRRIGPMLTEEIMQNGRIYSASEMHAMGIVNQIVENGCAKEAAYDFIASRKPTHTIRNSICKIRQCVNPIRLDELRSITELWVDATLKLSPLDLKTMQRFVSAQQRRLQKLSG